jgi:hypothetical protein
MNFECRSKGPGYTCQIRVFYKSTNAKPPSGGFGGGVKKKPLLRG